MGCTTSSKSFNTPSSACKKPTQYKDGMEAIDIFHKFGLDEADRNNFQSVQDIIRKNTNDSFLLSDFLQYIEIPPNPFVLKILSIFKSMPSLPGTFGSFVEFCLSVWNFGTLSNITFGFMMMIAYTIHNANNLSFSRGLRVLHLLFKNAVRSSFNTLASNLIVVFY